MLIHSEDNILKLVLKWPNRSIKADFLNLFLSLAQRKEKKTLRCNASLQKKPHIYHTTSWIGEGNHERKKTFDRDESIMWRPGQALHWRRGKKKPLVCSCFVRVWSTMTKGKFTVVRGEKNGVNTKKRQCCGSGHDCWTISDNERSFIRSCRLIYPEKERIGVTSTYTHCSVVSWPNLI